MRKKLKVAYICHVSNAVIRENVPLRNIKWLNRIKAILRLPKSSYRDYSIWHTQLLERAQLLKNIELHAVIPFSKLACKQKDFQYDGVYYHVFFDESASISSRVFGRFKDITTRYKKNTKHIVSIINEVKPDVINMIGAEGPFYNSAALAIDPQETPLILTLQTAMSDPDFAKNYPISPKEYGERTKMEQAIMSHCHYIAHDSIWYRKIAKIYNPDAVFLRNTFMMPDYHIDANVKKEFDFVYYAANISKAGKDAVEAFGRASMKNSHITMNIIGGYSDETYNELIKILKHYNCEDRVVFSGYFPSHEEALRQVVKSRIALVPIKIDLISGTITESVKLGLPVITYKTKGTPQMNDHGMAVMLSDIGDYDHLAADMLELAENQSLCEELKKNAYTFISKFSDNDQAAMRLGRVYHAVYDNFHQGTRIPEELTESIY